MANKCISKLTRLWPPSASPIWFDNCLQGHLQTCLITASKFISKFNLILASKCSPKLAWSWRPGTSLSYSIFASKCISKSAWSRPQSAYQSYTISAAEYISQLARWPPPSASLSSTRSGPPGASLSSLNQSLQVLLRLRFSTICRQIGCMYKYGEI